MSVHPGSTPSILSVPRRRAALPILAILLALAAAATPAAAQVMEGRVVEQTSLHPVAAAQVLLLDAAGEPVADAVTDVSGAFRVQAPAAGEFRLRVYRVGMRTTLTRAVPLAAGEAVAVEVRMAAQPVALDTAFTMARRAGISGRVVDEESGQPVAGATVTMLNARQQRTARAVTDSAGEFHLGVRDPGAYELRAERMGFQPSASAPITVMPDDTVQVELRLSTSALVLAPLTVVASSRQVMRDHQLAGFEWRRERQPFGEYMGPDEIKRINPFYASDILQQVPSVRVEGGFERVVTLPTRMALFGSGGRCIPNLYVDGQAIPNGFSVDNMVSGRSVAAVEVYDSPAMAPGEFPARQNPYCGVVVIWTEVAGDRG